MTRRTLILSGLSLLTASKLILAYTEPITLDIYTRDGKVLKTVCKRTKNGIVSEPMILKGTMEVKKYVVYEGKNVITIDAKVSAYPKE